MGRTVRIRAGNDLLARFIGFLRHDGSASLTELVDRLIPERHVALRVAAASVENAAAMASALHHMPFMALRTDDARVDHDGFIRAAGRTFQITAIGACAIDHERTAGIAFHIRHLFRPFGKAVRLDVLAVRIIRAGEIFPIAAHFHDHLCTAFLTGDIRDFLILLLILFCFYIR